ncbi:MAG: ABC transporter permease [Gemmatimonadetes bacterium]|nr:MAG: ABC transporter permease [Gemmatimonadota bacterium]
MSDEGRPSAGPGGRRPIHPRPVEDDVRRELDAHLALSTEDLIAHGWTAAEARAEARRRFGDEEEVRRRMEKIARSHDRRRRRALRLEALLQDVRFAFRTLRRTPGMTLVALGTLALGIGANTAVFSVVEGVLLRPLPFQDPGRIVTVLERSERFQVMGAAWPNFLDWEARSRSAVGWGAYVPQSLTILGPERGVAGQVARVSAGFFTTLGVQPESGRLLRPDEHRAGADPAAVVSHGFWQRELGSRTDLENLSVDAGGMRLRIVGVLPASFDFPAGTDLWFPIELEVWGEHSRTAHNYRALARLAPGVDLDTAQRELDALMGRLTAGEPAGDYLATGVVVRRLHDALTARARRPLLLLASGALLVLLIACANLAGTFLARAETRLQEMAVRASLGAGRGRLARQLLTEASLLSALGALAGTGLAAGVLAAVRRGAPTALPRLEDVHVSGTALAIAGAAAVLTATLFGLAPAVRAARVEPGRALGGASRSVTGGGRRGRVPILVTGQIALATVLLTTGGLLARSLAGVLAVDPGFDSGAVAVANLQLPPSLYPDDAALVAAYDRLLAELAARPGVASAGLGSLIPMGAGFASGSVRVEGGPEPTRSGAYQVVDTGFFAALDIPLLRGRLFEPGDDAGRPDVVVVSRSFAEAAWPGQDPIGKRMNGGGMDGYLDASLSEELPWDVRNRWATVIGVVGDVRYQGLTAEAPATYYFHYRQRPARARAAGLVARGPRAAGSPTAPTATLRDLLRDFDPLVPARVEPLERLVARSTAERRLTLTLLAAFALLALGLSALGIYGVVSFAVARRTREMGIRLALGARPEEVRSLVQRGAFGMATVGLVVGVAGALAAGRVVEGLLYGVQPTDPLTLGVVAALVGGASWAASWWPARRSARVDPALTMRTD